MEKNVIIAIVLMNVWWWGSHAAPPPFSVTIDCGPDVDKSPMKLSGRLGARAPSLSPAAAAAPDPATLCDCIERAFPSGVKDGRFLLRSEEQLASGDTRRPVRVPPPRGFLPPPRGALGATQGAPPDSAERLERFQKGVQKMMRVVDVLGQVDQYLSDRTRILVSKLSKVYEE